MALQMCRAPALDPDEPIICSVSRSEQQPVSIIKHELHPLKLCSYQLHMHPLELINKMLVSNSKLTLLNTSLLSYQIIAPIPGIGGGKSSS